MSNNKQARGTIRGTMATDTVQGRRGRSPAAAGAASGSSRSGANLASVKEEEVARTRSPAVGAGMRQLAEERLREARGGVTNDGGELRMRRTVDLID